MKTNSSNLLLLLRGIREVGLRPTWDALAHVLRSRWCEARYADPERPLAGLALLRALVRQLLLSTESFPPPGPLARTPGALQSWSQDGQTVTLTFEQATLTLTVLAPDLLRICLSPANSQPAICDPQSAIRNSLLSRPDPDWSPCPLELRETPAALELHTGKLVCAIARAGGRLAFRDAQGWPIAAESAPSGWSADGRVLSHWSILPATSFYGLGQRAAAFDRLGGSFVNWNKDPRTYGPGDDPLDLCIPFLLALHDAGRQGYGLLLHNTARSRVDLGRSDPATARIEVEDSVLDYDFFYGPALTAVIERYAERSGRPPLWPRWALGYQQSRWSYFPADRVRRLAADFQTHDVPCSAIHLDIHYMDGYRCFTWDAERFPDPAGLIADLHAQGLRVVTVIDSGIKADRRYSVFQQGLQEGLFCRYPDGRPFIGPVWPGNCAFPDFTDPRTREWWGELHRDLLALGVDGIWDDMNEPSVFGEDGATLPGPLRHDLDGCGGDHRLAHNVYGLYEVRATFEGLSRLQPERRPLVLTRSGWSGAQRYAINWTGDNRSDWDSLRLTLPMVLGLGLSGLSFTGADVGGFAGFASAELFTRWLQLGAFLPFYRAHTVFDSPDQEPWSWGEPYLTINREVIRLRCRLLPYLYTAVWQSTQNGLPLARPLLLAYQDDPQTHALADEFLCGDALLVAPVLEEGATRRRLYLPTGEWYDFWSDERLEGPSWVEVDAPLERIPLFVRAGSVLPLAPANDLHVYPGHSVSWLYEDDGESTAYRQGEYRLTRWELSAGTASALRCHCEGNLEPLAPPVDVVIHGLAQPPRAATVDGQPVDPSAWRAEGSAVRLSLAHLERLEWS